MNFTDIPPLTKLSVYAVDVGWDYLPEYLDGAIREEHLILEPDFQRGHVWTLEQRTAYVEYALRSGAITGKDLYFNCKNWHLISNRGPYVIVDGLQRLTSVMMFLRNELPAYGHLRREFTGRMRLVGPSFRWHVNDLKTRAEVLNWYLDFNAGGTPHTEQELDRVRKMLAKDS